ncbi:MAG: undecaprenyl-diphosphate phosphatase [Dehalococcoidia bacterium]
MSLIEIIILSIIQGLTEFLPVSSTGHIIIFSDILNFKTPDIYFDITVHLGSLLAILFYFRNNFLAILKLNNKFVVLNTNLEIPYKKLYILILLSTLPLIICVIIFGLDFFEKIRSSMWVGLFLIFTSIILYFGEIISHKNKTMNSLSISDSIIIGVFQCLSIFPGISRSAMTIFSGLLIGMDRQSAMVYSFILSIPTILAAVLLMLINNYNEIYLENILMKFLIPTFFSFIFSFIAISFIIRYLKKGTFKPFAIYCLFSGLLLVIKNIF